MLLRRNFRPLGGVPLRSFSATTRLPYDAAGGADAGGGRKNWMLNLLGYYGEESTRLRNAEALFQSCVDQASKKSWLVRGRVANEFRPRHALLLTHIWLIHKRLLKDGQPGKLLQESVFDLLWDDTSMRIRSKGISELSVNKNLGDVQKYSFPLLVSYDQAMGLPTQAEQEDHLGAAAWRNLWMADQNLTVEHCMEMARYLQRENAAIQALDTDAFNEGRIPWGPVPTWEGVKSLADGTELAVEDMDAEDDDLGDWREAMAVNGKPYYWNVKTRESSWTKPC